MDAILPRSLDSIDYKESAQGFLTEVAPPDTPVTTKLALAATVVLLGGAAYYGYRLATKRTSASDEKTSA